MKAWHFVGDKLRDRREIPKDGEKLIHNGSLSMCITGLHASVRLIDALKYAPGNTICRVECGGKIIKEDDKLVCSERTILWRIDGDKVLRKAACRFALSVKHLWDMPEIVERYLKMQDESLRLAAWIAARDAASVAAWVAARDAASAAQNRTLTALVMAEHKRGKK